MNHAHVVFGIYKTRADAEEALAVLQDDGFRASDLSILVPDDAGKVDPVHFVGSNDTRATEGAASGAGTGAVIGGALGVLAGIGILGIPGIGPFLAAGPIMMALAGVGVGGAVGGLSGALSGFGMLRDEAIRYEGLVKEGGILVAVHADDESWTRKAGRLLQQTGATEISYASEERQSIAGRAASLTRKIKGNLDDSRRDVF